MKKQLNILGIGIFIIYGTGVYAELGASAGLAENSLWLSSLFIACIAFLAAFSQYEFAKLLPAKAIYIYLMNNSSNSKLPFILLVPILVVTVVAKTATASLTFQSFQPLIVLLINIASGWANALHAINVGFITMLIIGRMVYEAAMEKNLLQLLNVRFMRVIA